MPPPVEPGRLMPVAQSQGHAGKALRDRRRSAWPSLLVLALLVAQAASRGDVEVRLGDDRFEVGDADDLRRARSPTTTACRCCSRTSSTGTATSSCSTLGDAAREGWVAFGAFDPDDPDCAVEIDREAGTLVNACDDRSPSRSTARGCAAYPVSVEDGRLFIDLNETARRRPTGP